MPSIRFFLFFWCKEGLSPSKIKLQEQSACFTDILKEIKLKF